MKYLRLIALLLVFSFLSGCAAPAVSKTIEQTAETEPALTIAEDEVVFSSMSDPELPAYLEEAIYSDLLSELDSEAFFVENVDSVYISKEYIEELNYNSQENVFFGYNLSDLDECFMGTRYVFNVDENGQTIVEELQEYDDAYLQMLKNVAIGTGVILLCVTVTAVTSASGASAVSLVFACSTKEAIVGSMVGAFADGIVSGIGEYAKTKDVEKSFKTAMLRASEGFKWGAIAGALDGTASGTVQYQKAMKALKGVDLNGLSLQSAAAAQMKTGWSAETIKQIKNLDELDVYLKAGLKEIDIDGQKLLVKQDIDWNYKTKSQDKMMSNLERIKEGKAPIDKVSQKPYELHHIGQKENGTLAMLTSNEHRENASVLNIPGKETEIDRVAFDALREKLYKELAKIVK